MRRNWCIIFIIFTFIVFFTPLKSMAIDDESEQETVSTVEESELPSGLPSENEPGEETSGENSFNDEQVSQNSQSEEQLQEQPQENVDEAQENQDNNYEEDYIDDEEEDYDYYRYYAYNNYYEDSSSSTYVDEESEAAQGVSSDDNNSSNIQNSTSVEPSSEQAINDMSSQLDKSTQTLSVPQLLGTGVETIGGDNKFVGIIAWFCVVLGVAIVIAVLFSGKNKGNGFIGRKRYKSYGSKSKKKRLLSDKYYNKTRYR